MSKLEGNNIPDAIYVLAGGSGAFIGIEAAQAMAITSPLGVALSFVAGALIGTGILKLADHMSGARNENKH